MTTSGSQRVHEWFVDSFSTNKIRQIGTRNAFLYSKISIITSFLIVFLDDESTQYSVKLDTEYRIAQTKSDNASARLPLYAIERRIMH
jgi:hypothetical protein